MKPRYNKRHDNSGIEIALANFSLTFAKALLVFCVVMFMLINPHNGKDGVKPNAEYLINVQWVAQGHRYDIDTWVKLPDGHRVNYNNKESGIVFLERDDLGNDCQNTTNDGKTNNICEEITVIRGVKPGEYQISLHVYSVDGTTIPNACIPIKIFVKLEKLNPTTTIVWADVIVLDRIRQEKTVLRFTVNPSGAISDYYVGPMPSIIYGDGK